MNKKNCLEALLFSSLILIEGTFTYFFLRDKAFRKAFLETVKEFLEKEEKRVEH